MPCYHPITGFRARSGDAGRRRGVVYSARTGFRDLPVRGIPCGQCIGCRVEKQRQWSVRLMHEASLHEQNSFVTLTYNDQHLPPYGSLRKRDFQLFLKRLRKQIEPRKIRYFHVGEYGEDGRPHYHALLFGIDFSEDRFVHTMRGEHFTFRSPLLEKCWTYGFSEIGSVTEGSARYVAKYCLKKVTGKKADDVYTRFDDESGELVPIEHEYATMSRRPGIGYGWFEKYQDETYRDDSVVVGGKEMLPPRYYDDKFKEVDPERFAELQEARQGKRRREDETDARLAVREKVRMSRLSTFTKDGSL